MTRSLPPAQAHGIVIAMIATGYQWGSEGGPAVPGRNGTQNAYGKAHDAERQSMLHGPIGREPRCEVAARDAKDDAIGRRKQEERIAHRLAPRREDAGCVQRHVSGGGENEDREEACEYGADASKNEAWTVRLSHASRAPLSIRASDANNWPAGSRSFPRPGIRDVPSFCQVVDHENQLMMYITSMLTPA